MSAEPRPARSHWAQFRTWTDGSVAGAFLSLDPPIVYTAWTWGLDRMEWIKTYEPHLGSGPAMLLVYLIRHFSDALPNKWILTALRDYKRRHPSHEVHILCNAPDEVETLARYGQPSLLLNHNLTVSETIFRPLAGTERSFDAIYVARLSPDKRLELAAGIDRVAYVASFATGRDRYANATIQAIEARRPDHVFINQWKDGWPLPLDGEAINLALSLATVGLCLSETEGAMLSSMEYLLAGLPVVTTPSTGGREFFFDPDYCLTVAPDPRAVREGVLALKNRNIPRGYVRQRTLERIAPQRHDFLELLDDFLIRTGYAPRFGKTWPWSARRNLCMIRTIPELIALAESELTSRPRGYAAEEAGPRPRPMLSSRPSVLSSAPSAGMDVLMNRPASSLGGNP